jgi:hypothetical protein
MFKGCEYMATNYDINYNDKRFKQVESDKAVALNEVEKTYGGMISESEKFYQDQIDASKEWAEKQAQLQQEKSDFAIDKIEQEKQQAQKDYTKEQSGAYVDWQKQSNEYGVNAEKTAAAGLANTGYSESSQVSMYNTHQNRVTAAREAFNKAVLNYNNAITEARLQNNSVLAEIAAEALQKQLELSLQGFQYKNTLILEKANKKTALETEYYNRWQDVLKQINTENALAEEIRQYNASLAEQQRQFNALHSDSASSSGGSGSISKGSSSKPKSAKEAYSYIQNKRNTSVSSNKNDGTIPINMASVTALGYGPISASRLNQLVAQGVVEEYVENGERKFRRKTAKTSTKKNSSKSILTKDNLPKSIRQKFGLK